MKKLIIWVTMAVTLTLFGIGNALADWSLHLENQENDNVFEIWFFTDEEVTLNNYALSFRFDTDEMSWDDKLYTNTPPSPLVELFGAPLETSSGLIENLTAAAFVGGATVSTNIELGTLTFDILPTAVKDGSDDLWWAVDPGDNTNFIVTVDDVEYNFRTDNPDFGDLGAHLTTGLDLDVTAVPIPGAVWLLGSCMLGLLGFNRKNKK